MSFGSPYAEMTKGIDHMRANASVRNTPRSLTVTNPQVNMTSTLGDGNRPASSIPTPSRWRTSSTLWLGRQAAAASSFAVIRFPPSVVPHPSYLQSSLTLTTSNAWSTFIRPLPPLAAVAASSSSTLHRTYSLVDAMALLCSPHRSAGHKKGRLSAQLRARIGWLHRPPAVANSTSPYRVRRL